MKTVGQRDLMIDEQVRDNFINPIDRAKDRIGMFTEKTDIYLLAAILGFQNKTKAPSKKRSTFRQAHELNDDQDLIIYTIGFAEKNNIDLLVPEPEPRRELFRLIEEYANAGAPLLHEMLMFKSDKTKNLEENVWDKIKQINSSH